MAPITQPTVDVTSLIQQLRSQMQSGAITPAAAKSQLYSAIQQQSTTPQGTSVQQSTVDAANSQLFQPMTISAGGQQAQLNSDGSISLQSAKVSQSSTGSAGTSTSTSFAPGGSTSGDPTLDAFNQSMVNSPSTGSPGSGGSSTTSSSITSGVTPTGSPALDTLTQGFADYISGSLASGFSVNPGLNISTNQLAQFVQETIPQLDPKYTQNLETEINNVYQTVQNLATNYSSQSAADVLAFQQSLGAQRNAAGQSGMYLGGGENQAENALQQGSQYQLNQLASNAQYGIGQALNAGGAALGQGIQGGSAFGVNIPGLTSSSPIGGESDSNLSASSLQTPSLYNPTLSLSGGSGTVLGGASQGSALNYNYNPAMYQYGSIPASYASDFLNQLNQSAANYQQSNIATGLSNQAGGSLTSSYGNSLPSGTPVNYSGTNGYTNASGVYVPATNAL